MEKQNAYRIEDGPDNAPKRKSVNIYPSTHSKLRILAALRGEAMIDTVDALVKEALEKTSH